MDLKETLSTIKRGAEENVKILFTLSFAWTSRKREAEGSVEAEASVEAEGSVQRRTPNIRTPGRTSEPRAEHPNPGRLDVSFTLAT